MKKVLVLVFCVFLSAMAEAQTSRVVNGVVFNENDAPMSGVKITAIGVKEPVITGPDGVFLLQISPYATQVEASCEGYLNAHAEIDGSYIIFRMKVDKKYAERKAAEESARQDAERAKAKAEEEARIAAEKKAAAEAEAKRKVEEASRVAAEKEAMAKAKAEEEARIAAEKKAAAEAEAKRKAEEAARVAAEKEAMAKAKAEEEARIAAEKKAAAEAEAKRKAEEAARIAAQKEAEAKARAEEKAKKKAERQAVDQKYNSQYRNKGLIHTLELSYGYPLASGNVIYENFGFRQYGTLHPVEAVYMIGYRFCNWVSLSVGAGLTYDIVNLRNYGDKFYSGYQNSEKYSNWNIPVFLNVKTYLMRGKYQPMISLSGGIYAPNIEILCDFGLGCNFRLSKRCNMYLLASFGTVPYGLFIDPLTSGSSSFSYSNETAWSPRIKVGFTL